MPNRIIPKKSSVAAKVPLATDLSVGEIAINLVDKKIYSKDSGGTVIELANGTVTSVGVSVPTGLSVSGTPVTTSGTIAISLTSGYAIPTTASQTNWDSAYTQRLQWDGGSTNLVAATARTSLGGTTVGQNLFTLTNPSAITFPRINADNTVSALDAATFRTAIGAGTSSTTGTVTSVSGTGTASGLTLSGTVTSSGSLTLSGTVNALAAGTYAISISGNAATATELTVPDLRSTSITPSYFGQGLNTAFMSNSTDGLSDGGTYHGVLQLQQWSDSSGGGSHQLGFTDNNNIWHRGSSGALTSWSTWAKLIDSANYNSYAPTLTGTGASGTWGISISGNAATATNADTLDGQHAAAFALVGQTTYIGTTAVAINRASASLSLTGVSIDGSAGSVAWSGVSSKPTTLSGYGITDALALSGGSLTGGLKEAKVAMAANDVNISSGNYFTKTISGATTLTVSNVPTTGTVAAFVLDLTNGGSATITWWTGMKWVSGTAPTLTTSGRDVLAFFTHDGGTTWSGFVLGKDVK